MPFLELRDSDTLEVGDLVLAIGNPFGLNQTVTSGIISALARSGSGVTENGFFIQTDAAINPGNSGGALVAMDGRLIGINTAIFSRSGGSIGIGFATPSNIVARMIDAGEKGRRMVRCWIGAAVQRVTADIATSLNLSRPHGVILRVVAADGPAAKAGLRVGDVILTINEQPIDDESAMRFRLATCRSTASPASACSAAARSGRSRPLTAPENPPRDRSQLSGRNPLAGVTVMNMSPAVADELGVNAWTQGVVVAKIAPGAPIGRVMRPGDYIVSVNGQPIDSVASLRSALGGERPGFGHGAPQGRGPHLHLPRLRAGPVAARKGRAEPQAESLFTGLAPAPLADRLRPRSIEEVVGQDHVLAATAPLGRMLASGRLGSLIFVGPSGCGKTTIARLLADRVDLHFEPLSAVFSGVADLRKIFEAARNRRAAGQGTLLFVDEIHRFNRAQQDGFLPYVEDGTVTLVGATTENPSFELNAALLSRCQVLVLRRLDDAALRLLIRRAEQAMDRPLPLDEAGRDALCAMADGDGRYLLGMAEQLFELKDQTALDAQGLAALMQKRAPIYDKAQESHYNLISALHKSCAARTWMHRSTGSRACCRAGRIRSTSCAAWCASPRRISAWPIPRRFSRRWRRGTPMKGWARPRAS